MALQVRGQWGLSLPPSPLAVRNPESKFAAITPKPVATPPAKINLPEFSTDSYIGRPDRREKACPPDTSDKGTHATAPS